MGLDPQGTFLDVQVTLDGVATNDVEVRLFFADPGDTTGEGGQCITGTLAPDGVAQFSIDPAQSYCVATDPNADASATVVSPVEVGTPPELEEFDPADDIDLVIDEAS